MSEELTQQLPNDDLKRILARLDSIDGRLVTLEDKVDRRLQETRLIWEQVLKRLDGVESRLNGVETRLDGVETRLSGVETGLKGVESEVYNLNRKFRVFTADMLKLQDTQEDLDERLRKLESEPAQ